VVSVNGAIVTIKFEVANAPFTLPQVTIPVATSVYVREPLKAGDKGVCVAADAYLGGVSGLGGGTADLTERANLTALAFQPLGSTSFPSVDANAVVIGQGASNGVRLQDGSGAAVLLVQPSGITMTFGGHTVVLNSTGFVIDGIVFETHRHSDVMNGGSDTGPPL
jgi:hypothetical protein